MNASPVLTDLEFHLLNDWQRGFPLTSRPYAALARRLGCGEREVIETLAALKARGHVSRIGAVFRPHVLGASTLAALACPPGRIEAVARQVNTYPEINHNYEREHDYNLWFVVVAPSRERVSAVLADIHRESGLQPLDLPMVADYHIDLGFELAAGDRPAPRAHLDAAGDPVDVDRLRACLDPVDYTLAAALEGGLTFTLSPFAAVAAACGMAESTCLARIERLLSLSVMRRFGVVVRHRELGYTANAMVVWNVSDVRVRQVGRYLATQPGVTLCYQRPRRLPDWPYNLFSMVHGRDRAAVLQEVARLRQELELDESVCRPLFSVRRFKQCGARYAVQAKVA